MYSVLTLKLIISLQHFPNIRGPSVKGAGTLLFLFRLLLLLLFSTKMVIEPPILEEWCSMPPCTHAHEGTHIGLMVAQ